MSEEQEDQGFRVTDKRSFTETGNPRTQPAEEDRKRPDPSGRAESEPPGSPSGEAPRAHAPIDFASYIFSFYTESLMFLGELPNPITNKTEEDLNAARDAVDLLGMLKEKTKGNLTADEDQLLDKLLFDIRMKFMAKVKHIKLP